MRRVASIACWRAENRAQRPVRASVAAMSPTCARSADVVKDRVLPGGSLCRFIARYGTVLRNPPRGRRGLRKQLARRSRQKNISPCLHASGQGIALIPLSSPPSRRGGWHADKAQCPDCSRRMSGNGRTMVHSGAPAPCGAPTGIFGLRLVNGRTSRSSLSLVVLSERRPWAGLRDCRPAGALPLRALRTPPEGALELGSGWVTRRVKNEGSQEIFTEGE